MRKKICEDKMNKLDKELVYLKEECDFKISKNSDALIASHYNKKKIDEFMRVLEEKAKDAYVPKDDFKSATTYEQEQLNSIRESIEKIQEKLIVLHSTSKTH